MSKNLIEKYLSGELTDSEVKRLYEWVSGDENNRKYFAQVKNTWVASGRKKQEKNIDVSKEKQLFDYRKTIQKTSGNQIYRIKSIEKSKWDLFLKVAATILLVYSIGITSSKYFIPNETQYNELVTRNGEKSQITLVDGSNIWLNSNSSLRYPEHMNEKNIDIFLDGEAFFDINKVPGRKIAVHTSDLKINVLGTAFNVKSYPEDGITETTLVRGKITIDGKRKKLNQQLVLKPHQQATFISSSGSFVVSDVNEEKKEETVPVNTGKPATTVKPNIADSKAQMIISESVDTDLFTSWKDGKLVFKSERFEDLALRMERWYDVKIEIRGKELKNSRYTGTFEKESIEQALRALSLSLPFDYSIDQNRITISRK